MKPNKQTTTKLNIQSLAATANRPANLRGG